MKNYHYLSNPYVTIQGIDEVEEYNNTIKAMHIMGMSNEDIICKCRDGPCGRVARFNDHT